MQDLFERPRKSLVSLLFLVFGFTAGHALTVGGAQAASADDSKPSQKNSIYAKIILPMKEAADGEHPLVESWIERKLRKRGETEFRAATPWVRLAEEGEEITQVWNGTVGGKDRECPVVGRVVDRTADGKVKVRVSRLGPLANTIKRDTLRAEVGSRRIAVVAPDSRDSSKAFVLLFVGPPPVKPESPPHP